MIRGKDDKANQTLTSSHVAWFSNSLRRVIGGGCTEISANADFTCNDHSLPDYSVNMETCKRSSRPRLKSSPKKNTNRFTEDTHNIHCFSMANYLDDSTPFLVDLTKKSALPLLVISTRPPLLSNTPEWMAARHILDDWKAKMYFEKEVQ